MGARRYLCRVDQGYLLGRRLPMLLLVPFPDRGRDKFPGRPRAGRNAGVPQREPPARAFLLHFSAAPALGGLPRELLISQTRELPKGLFQRDFPAARIIATSSPLCT